MSLFRNLLVCFFFFNVWFAIVGYCLAFHSFLIRDERGRRYLKRFQGHCCWHKASVSVSWPGKMIPFAMDVISKVLAFSQAESPFIDVYPHKNMQSRGAEGWVCISQDELGSASAVSYPLAGTYSTVCGPHLWSFGYNKVLELNTLHGFFLQENPWFSEGEASQRWGWWSGGQEGGDEVLTCKHSELVRVIVQRLKGTESPQEPCRSLASFQWGALRDSCRDRERPWMRIGWHIMVSSS